MRARPPVCSLFRVSSLFDDMILINILAWTDSPEEGTRSNYFRRVVRHKADNTFMNVLRVRV